MTDNSETKVSLVVAKGVSCIKGRLPVQILRCSTVGLLATSFVLVGFARLGEAQGMGSKEVFLGT